MALPAIDQEKILTGILLCLRSPGGENRHKASGLLKGMTGDEWQEFAGLAHGFQLGPVLFRRLQADFEGVGAPASVLNRLRDDYLRSFARSVFLDRELGRILGSLSEHRIPVIVLKGACLAGLVYPESALRLMGDVDLLVKKGDLGTIDRAFKDLDYRGLDFADPAPGDTNEFHYRHEQTGLPVEIHWDLLAPIYPFPIDTGTLWESAVPRKISGGDALILAPEDLLLHVCLHASIHMFAAGLRDIYDIARLVEHQGASFDWPRLADRARRWLVSKGVFLALLLARRLLEAEIPEPALSGLRPDDFREDFYSTARTAVLSGQGNAAFRPNLPLVFGNKSVEEKISILKRKLFPSRSFLGAQFRVDADSPRIYACYPRHILGLLRVNMAGLRAIIKSRISHSAKSSSARSLVVLRNWMIAP